MNFAQFQTIFPFLDLEIHILTLTSDTVAVVVKLSMCYIFPSKHSTISTVFKEPTKFVIIQIINIRVDLYDIFILLVGGVYYDLYRSKVSVYTEISTYDKICCHSDWGYGLTGKISVHKQGTRETDVRATSSKESFRRLYRFCKCKTYN